MNVYLGVSVRECMGVWGGGKATFLMCWASKSVPSPFLQASSPVSPGKATRFGDVAASSEVK